MKKIFRFAASLLLFLPVLPAAAGTTGTVSGRITDQVSGQGLSAGVSAYSRTDGTTLGFVNADASGHYSLAGLPAGEVVIGARVLRHRSEYYDDVPELAGLAAATPVSVVAGGTTSGIDLALARLGKIRGRAIDAGTGEPISSCVAYARLLEPPRPSIADWIGYCSADGTFEIEDLWEGSYRVWIHPNDGHAGWLLGAGPCNLAENIPTEPICGPGEPLTIGVDEVKDLGDVRFEPGAAVSGTVYATGVFSPEYAKRPHVRLFDAAGRKLAERDVNASGTNFRIGNLVAGTYRAVLDGGALWSSEAYSGVPCSRWYCDPNRGEPIVLATGQQRGGVIFDTHNLAPYVGCSESATALCLGRGRFKVETTWHDFLGQSGPGRAVRVTDETAYFWFFSPGNVELMVKTLNACTPELGLHFWVFAAGLTNVQVETKVTDTLTGEIRTYGNPSGQVFAPILDIGAFATCAALEPAAAAGAPEVPAAELAARDPGEPGTEAAALEAPEALASCVADLRHACLAGGRFRASVRFRIQPGGPRYEALVHPLTGDTASFYFFNEDNIEMMVKVLDACGEALPGHWVFAAGLTDLEAEVTVEDTVSGQSKIYPGSFGPFQPILDLGAFAATCP